MACHKDFVITFTVQYVSNVIVHNLFPNNLETKGKQGKFKVDFFTHLFHDNDMDENGIYQFQAERTCTYLLKHKFMKYFVFKSNTYNTKRCFLYVFTPI